MTTVHSPRQSKRVPKPAISAPIKHITQPKTFVALHAAMDPQSPDRATLAKSQRKDQAKLTTEERQQFLNGINFLNQRGIFGQLVSMHTDMSHTMHNMGPADPTSPLGQQRFLPWHRVFLYQLEQQLQKLYPNIAIPYWDWSKTEDQGIPDWLNQLQLTVNVMEAHDGAIMPVPVPVHRTPLSQDQLAQSVSPLNAVLKLTTYLDFATDLENIHNDVHTWVGGTMGQIPTAAADPLFWMHHANVDRIWWQWQQSTQGKGQNPTLDGDDTIMDPWRYSELDTQDITTFNYEYIV